VPEFLVRGWKGYGPALRLQVVAMHCVVRMTGPGFPSMPSNAVPCGPRAGCVRRQRLLAKTSGLRPVPRKYCGRVPPDRQKLLNALPSRPTHPPPHPPPPPPHPPPPAPPGPPPPAPPPRPQHPLGTHPS